MVNEKNSSSTPFIIQDNIHGRQRCILLFSDDEEVHQTFASLLNDSDLQLHVYQSIDELKRIYDTPELDLIIFDIHLTGKSMYTICSDIKNHDDTRNIPILLLAREEEKDSLIHALRFGADDFVHVPIFPQELLVRMRSLLGSHAWQQQAQKSRERVMIISKLVFGLNMGLTLPETIVPSLPDIAKHVKGDVAFVMMLDSDEQEKERIVPVERKDAAEISVPLNLIKRALQTLKPQMEVTSLNHDKLQPVREPSQTIVLVPITERQRRLALLGVVRKEPVPFYENEIVSLSLISDILAMSISRSLYLHEIAKAHLTVKREFQLMGRLQKLLLPRELPEIQHFQFQAFYQPAMDAGGDYYDIIQLTDYDYAVVVADVSGHGAPAAMNMGIARSILHTVSLSQNISPSGTLYFLNKLLYRLLGEDAHITMFYCVLNVKERKLKWSNAGHVPCFIRHTTTKELEVIGDPSDGPPLGWWNTAEFEEHTTYLETNDLVLLYTDGVVEAQNMQKEQFHMDRISDILSSSEQNNPEAVIETIVEAVEKFLGDMPLLDDLTLLAFQHCEESRSSSSQDSSS